MERETGLEPATPSLEGLCSSQLSYSRLELPRIANCVALRGGEGRIRTSEGRSQQVYSLSRLTTSVPLRRTAHTPRRKNVKNPSPLGAPHSLEDLGPKPLCVEPVQRDRTLLTRRRKPALPPRSPASGSGAGEGTRTSNLLITSQLLYQLSYASAKVDCIRRFPRRQRSLPISEDTRREGTY